MNMPFYQVDAFSDRAFAGNPAAVCVLREWLDDDVLGAIASENNLSETAFLMREIQGWRVRWFTPMVEVNLCGHATLAAAHVAFTELGVGDVPLVLASRSGPLEVEPLGDGRYRMDFPATPAEQYEATATLIEALGTTPRAAWIAGEDVVVDLDDATAVRGVEPDFGLLAEVVARGIIVTGPGDGTDFCSRFFGPRVGVPEDPVTGSAHCALAPLWAHRLGRNRLTAAQLSRRGGDLVVEMRGDRVWIEGSCRTVIVGEFRL